MKPASLKWKSTKTIKPQSNTSKKFNDLSELANSIYLKIKDDYKELKNRELTTFFYKIQPNKEDLQALNEIAEALVTTQPEINPTLDLNQLCNLCNYCCMEKLHQK